MIVIAAARAIMIAITAIMVATGREPPPIVKHVKNPLTERLIKKPDLLPNDDIIDFIIPEKPKDFDKKIRELRKEMERSAKELNFKLAATFRDQIKKMKEIKSARS